MKKVIASVTVLLVGISLIGCGTGTKSSGANSTTSQPSQQSSQPSTPQQPPAGQPTQSSTPTPAPAPAPAPTQSKKNWELVGKNYKVQGTITAVNQTSTDLHSLTIKVTKNILSPTTSAENMFQVGAPLDVRFDEPLADKGNFNLKPGDEVILGIGQYQAPGSADTFWGGTFANTYVQQNGKFLDSKGNALPND